MQIFQRKSSLLSAYKFALAFVAMPGHHDSQKIKENVSNLDSNEQEVLLRAVREVKNAIIGSKTKKASYSSAGAVKKLINILFRTQEPSLVVHAVGSWSQFRSEF